MSSTHFSFLYLLSLGMISLSSPAQTWAMDLPNPPIGAVSLDARTGITSTALSMLFTVPFGQYSQQEREFVLADGTRIGGFLFIKEDSNNAARPLIIANFGVLSDRWADSTSLFIKEVILKDRLNANVLIVDSVSSGSFSVQNGNLSLGGYDEGRILNELAEHLNHTEIPHSSLHLLGVSLCGLATIQALIEDARLGTRHFTSAISISGAVAEAEISDEVMATFGYFEKGSARVKLGTAGAYMLGHSLGHFNEVRKYFGDLTDVDTTTTNAGKIFYDQFSRRLKSLTENSEVNPTWNPAVSRDSVEAYLQSSSDLLVQNADRIQVPLIAIHSVDDPIIPFSEFAAFAEREEQNQNILTLATPYGGHWGYLAAYGPDWVADLITRILPESLSTH